MSKDCSSGQTSTVLYRIVRAIVASGIRLFYRVETAGDLKPQGPVLFAGNHPNGLIDPALLFALCERRITFLAKAPLFRLPVLGWLLRGIGALAVYRKQDDPSAMGGNEATLEAASKVLTSGGALMIFPEGKSHSNPDLAELKTGAARMALSAGARGARVNVVPVGLTYESKRHFQSDVRVEVGAAIPVAERFPKQGPDNREAVRELTEEIDAALRQVTLNLDAWEDLPLLQTAERLYALELGDEAGNAERLRSFSDGLKFIRQEAPEKLAPLQGRLAAYQRRLSLVRARPGAVPLEYRPSLVFQFVLRNLLAWLIGFPLFVLGMALFVVPYHLPLLVVRLFRIEEDVEATAKLLTAFLVAPAWYAFLIAAAWFLGGPGWGLVAVLGTFPLALFTQRFFERRTRAVEDARLFFTLLGRRKLRARLVSEGERLAKEVEKLVTQLAPKVEARRV